MRNVEVPARICELQTAVTTEVVKLDITGRSNRLAMLQDLVDRCKMLIDARGLDIADVPGGGTGLLCRDYKREGLTAKS